LLYLVVNGKNGSYKKFGVRVPTGFIGSQYISMYHEYWGILDYLNDY
jgi:hypothetical protein